jgi:hypothetical protein
MYVHDYIDESIIINWIIHPFFLHRGPICLFYALTCAYEVAGVKKQIKYAMATLICMLKHPEGRRELREMLPEVELEIVTQSGIILW